jgi:multidrug efflux pump subunit AcrB
VHFIFFIFSFHLKHLISCILSLSFHICFSLAFLFVHLTNSFLPSYPSYLLSLSLPPSFSLSETAAILTSEVERRTDGQSDLQRKYDEVSYVLQTAQQQVKTSLFVFLFYYVLLSFFLLYHFYEILFIIWPLSISLSSLLFLRPIYCLICYFHLYA